MCFFQNYNVTNLIIDFHMSHCAIFEALKHFSVKYFPKKQSDKKELKITHIKQFVKQSYYLMQGPNARDLFSLFFFLVF